MSLFFKKFLPSASSSLSLRDVFFVQCIVLLTIFVNYGSAIDCYTCSSIENPGCTNIKKAKNIKPEPCNIYKLNSFKSWISDLNSITLHNSSSNVPVPMNCQKMVGRRQGEDPVTVRLCQLDMGDTDPCSIPKEKLSNDKSIEIIHCSICKKDGCNGSDTLHLFNNSTVTFSLLTIFLIAYFKKSFILD